MKTIIKFILIQMFLIGLLHAAEEKQAKIENGIPESMLATVTLTESAEKRLAVLTEPVERKEVRVTRLYGGELVLVVPSSEDGQSIFSLLPQMAPADLIRLAGDQIDADGNVKSTTVELEASEITVKRAETLLRDKVGSVRSVDEAKARRDLARTAMTAAKAKRDLLGPPVLAAKSPKMLWVKVPVYVGELDQIDLKQMSSIGRLDGRIDKTIRLAKPVNAPPSTNPTASTVDLFYSIDNKERKLQPGQRVGVTVSLKIQSESLVVPHAAILYDINGGTWVYESLGDQKYARKRVQVSRVVGDQAVLANGPKPGARVVTDGAAEIFGTEFGVGK